MDTVRGIIETHLGDPATGWSLGVFGALAEFHREPDEPADTAATEDGMRIVTGRGAIHATWHPEIRLVPYEGLSTQPTAWTQGVMVCLPEATAAMHGRTELTELDGATFDLGFGLGHVDICIRTEDGGLTDILRRHVGTPFLQLGADVMEAIKSASPDRLFASKLGYIEVTGPIPRSGQESPMGPHTHILPALLGRGRNHAANVPVPDGLVPALAFYPPHPVRDVMGELKSFDKGSYERFQRLLQTHAPADIVAAKRAAWRALDLGSEPDAAIVPNGRAERTAFRVALRQWAHLNGASANQEAWRALCDPTRELEERGDHLPDG